MVRRRAGCCALAPAGQFGAGANRQTVALVAPTVLRGQLRVGRAAGVRTDSGKCSGIPKSLSVPPVEVRNKLGIVTIHRLNGLVHVRRVLCWVFPVCQDASRPSFLQNFTILSKFDEFGSLPPSRRAARMTKVLMERTVGSHKSGE